MPNRPHRRDRRAPANSTRGGAVTNISTLLITDADDASVITIQMALEDPNNLTFSYVAEYSKANPNLDISNWRYFDLGSEVTISSAALNDFGQITLTLAAPRVGEGILVLPPFTKALRGLSGSVNAGGPVYVGAPV